MSKKIDYVFSSLRRDNELKHGRGKKLEKNGKLRYVKFCEHCNGNGLYSLRLSKILSRPLYGARVRSVIIIHFMQIIILIFTCTQLNNSN